YADLVPFFAADARTKAVVVIGEIGGSEEEELAAALIEHKFQKPVFALVAGRSAREGVTMGRAGKGGCCGVWCGRRTGRCGGGASRSMKRRTTRDFATCPRLAVSRDAAAQMRNTSAQRYPDKLADLVRPR